ncbi:class I adenylate-forming enzyme family protein [Marimonas arenosa]|uniref:3-methylmercaptopropionyl-CoA ligase n=1 Tax=Marimonas arenosa TaxID=1795305 RepID=A0AAE4B5J1_9RHOB|nr:AMP-binding protein [Marimonas arenosa]MDQ2091400.1 AMP-binding protein [Marimonas arenosa]
MNIGLYLQRIAQVHGDRPALFSGREAVADYAGFYARAMQLAGWLTARGIGPGDRVAIFMKNVPDYLIVQYGIWLAGAVAVPINAKLHGREAAWIIENAEAGVSFASPGLSAALVEAGAGSEIVCLSSEPFAEIAAAVPLAAPVSRGADDLAWLFYTSGTTGRPKGVMITHRMLTNMALSYFVDVDQVHPEDTALYAAPLSHGAGIYNIMHVMVGAKHACPASGGFDEAEIFDLAAHHDRVHMFAAPTMVKRMTDAAKRVGARGEGLRTIVYGGGPMYLADIVEAVDWFGEVFVQIYGQGECPMAISALSRGDVSDRAHPRWRERLGSVGRAQSVVEVRIGDADGNPVAPDAPGEIMVRGDVVMPGYWQNPEATAKTLVNGWLRTGDVGSMDADGYVTMRDRSKDMIISGGTNIYPREVEEVLLEMPELSEVSVVGRPHPEWGEDVVAFVVMEPGHALDEAALDAHCLANIARFKRPKAYFVLGELPKNNYGKVLKTKLREMLEDVAND